MIATANIDLQDVRKRSAEIRGSWSAGERRRRMGLPPDIPAKLRDYILAPRAVVWPIESRV
jgi:hypothetical protein